MAVSWLGEDFRINHGEHRKYVARITLGGKAYLLRIGRFADSRPEVSKPSQRPDPTNRHAGSQYVRGTLDGFLGVHGAPLGLRLIALESENWCLWNLGSCVRTFSRSRIDRSKHSEKPCGLRIGSSGLRQERKKLFW